MSTSPHSSEPPIFTGAQLLAEMAWTRRLAASLVADSSAAEDLAQDTWLAALRRFGPRHLPARAWLRTVLVNFARRRIRQVGAQVDRERWAAVPEALPSASESLERFDRQRRLVEVVDALPEAWRQVILLRYADGLSPAQIAERLSLPGGTVRSHLKRALERMRERLDREDGGRAAWTAAFAPLLDVDLPVHEPVQGPWHEPGLASGSASARTGGTVTKLTTVAAGGLVLVGATAVLWPESVGGTSAGGELEVPVRTPARSLVLSPGESLPVVYEAFEVHYVEPVGPHSDEREALHPASIAQEPVASDFGAPSGQGRTQRAAAEPDGEFSFRWFLGEPEPSVEEGQLNIGQDVRLMIGGESPPDTVIEGRVKPEAEEKEPPE